MAYYKVTKKQEGGGTSDPVNISDFSFSNKVNTTDPTVTKISDYEFALSFQDQNASGYEQCLFKVTLPAGIYVAEIKATVSANTGITSGFTWGIYTSSSNANTNSNITAAYSTYVPFIRTDTNEHTYRVPILVKKNGYAYIGFATADDNGVNATITVSSLKIYPSISVEGGGIFTPTFSETKIVDNTTLASSFTFSEDYHNYDFLKFKLYNSSSTNYTIIITTPTTIDNIYTLTSLVNFNEVGNDQYVCYSQSSLTWSRSGRRNLDIYEIYGLDCTNATVTETQIYKASAMSGTWVDVTTQLNLFDFDWIMFASNDSSWDELQPCNDIYVPNQCTYDLFDESLRYYMFNDYSHAYTGTIGNHYLGALPFAYVAGIKFTPN